MAAPNGEVQSSDKCGPERYFASRAPRRDCMWWIQLFGLLAGRVVGEPKQCSTTSVVGKQFGGQTTKACPDRIPETAVRHDVRRLRRCGTGVSRVPFAIRCARDLSFYCARCG